jgi:hypothetical protein
MKKTLLLLLMLAAVVALTVTGAWADTYQFMPTTQVVSYQGTNAVPLNGSYWHSVIADTGDTSFNILGANLVSSTLDIYTGWRGGNYTDGGIAKAADLTLNSNGTTYMVRLYDTGDSNTQLGEIFTITSPSFYTSIDEFSAKTSYIYGGAYGSGPPEQYTDALPVPVWATGGDMETTTTVNWTKDNTLTDQMGYDVYEVSIDLSAITGFNPGDFSFLYASATCANSVLTGELKPTGEVPLPPSALLLGTGLLGLGWRRKRAS